MERIFGFATSNGNLTAHGIYPYRKSLQLSGENAPVQCGFAYFKPQDDVILKRRPYHLDSVNFWEPLIHNNISMGIGKISSASNGQSLVNTCPFRYRNWYFAMMGKSRNISKINDWLIGSLPPYLKRNISGNTETEHVFHLFLSYLYDGGIINSWDYNPDSIASSLRGTLDTWKLFASDAGEDDIDAVIIAGNSRTLIAVSTGSNRLGMKKIDGITGECAYCRDKLFDEKPHQHPDFNGIYLLAEAGDTPGDHGLFTVNPDEIILFQENSFYSYPPPEKEISR
ncbi:MAG: hypothetical protein JXR95_07500 [Deltaproteobacteria bacterium]|nr:hypothetical protein [Deltaproteobacteria bacterium]